LPKAGQFFLIKPERSAVFLARPISVAGWSVATEDRRDRSSTPDRIALRFLIAARGVGTEELAQLRVGERAFLTGPLGNSWWDKELATRIEPASPIALISGGIGVAPLAAFARELDSVGAAYDFYAGFRAASFGLEDLHPQSLVIATEDGCEGTRGLIPPLLVPQNYRAVYACGPVAMLKAVAGLCAAVSVPCFISMEKHMACGVGACLGCTIKTKLGSGATANRASTNRDSTNRRCCVDGPIFNAEEVVFDE
jgi:NAD(P)H-flavin reductase